VRLVHRQLIRLCLVLASVGGAAFAFYGTIASAWIGGFAEPARRAEFNARTHLWFAVALGLAFVALFNMVQIWRHRVR